MPVQQSLLPAGCCSPWLGKQLSRWWGTPRRRVDAVSTGCSRLCRPVGPTIRVAHLGGQVAASAATGTAVCAAARPWWSEVGWQPMPGSCVQIACGRRQRRRRRGDRVDQRRGCRRRPIFASFAVASRRVTPAGPLSSSPQASSSPIARPTSSESRFNAGPSRSAEVVPSQARHTLETAGLRQWTCLVALVVDHQFLTELLNEQLGVPRHRLPSSNPASSPSINPRESQSSSARICITI